MSVLFWVWSAAWAVWGVLVVYTCVRKSERAFSLVSIVGLAILIGVAIVGNILNWPVPQ